MRNQRGRRRTLLGKRFLWASPAVRWAVAAISGGPDHICGLYEDGSMRCWGNDDYGQSASPEGELFASVSAGRWHTCGLRRDGVVKCWGYYQGGESPPTEEARFTAISSGSVHTCGLLIDGTARCWGSDNNGQASPPPNERFTAISGGSWHTCGVTQDGTALCWGLDSDGQASPPIPTTMATATPTPISTPMVSPDQQRAALIAFYMATDGENWSIGRSWLSDAPLGEWYGVRTDSNGRVTQLDLSGNQLRGNLPPEIGSLTHLQSLFLYRNR